MSEVKRTFEGRLNKLLSVGLAILTGDVALSVSMLASRADPFTVLISYPPITVQIIELEYVAAWAGLIIGWTGVFRAMKSRMKSIIGSAIFASVLMYISLLILVPQLAEWERTLSIPLFNAVTAIIAGTILMSVTLMAWGAAENKNSRAKSNIPQRTS